MATFLKYGYDSQTSTFWATCPRCGRVTQGHKDAGTPFRWLYSLTCEEHAELAAAEQEEVPSA